MPKLSYEAACQEAAKAQGIDVILAKLHGKGIKEAYIWQSGGFTMVVRIDLPDGRYIMANAEGFGLYANEDDCEGKNVFSEDVNEIVKGIVEVLGR
jgi:hypothetical protein